MRNKGIYIAAAVLFSLGLLCLLFSRSGGNTGGYELRTLENHSGGNSITIKYPRFREAELSGMNEELVRGINQYLLDSYGAQVSELSLEMDCRVVRADEKLFSVIFEGTGSIAQAAHPDDLLFTITLDISAGKRLALSELYRLDGEFVKLLRERLIKQNGEVEEFFTNYTDEELLSWLTLADQAGQTSFSYLTDKALGISLPVAHAAGNHVETEIGFKELREYQLRTLA